MCSKEKFFFGLPASAGRVLQNRVCPSVRPSFRLSVNFLGSTSLVVSEISMVLGTLIELCVKEPDYLEKIPIGQK